MNTRWVTQRQLLTEAEPSEQRSPPEPRHPRAGFCCQAQCLPHLLGGSHMGWGGGGGSGFRITHGCFTRNIQGTEKGQYWRNVLSELFNFLGSFLLLLRKNEEMAVHHTQTHTHAHAHARARVEGQITIKEPAGHLLKWAAAITLSIQSLHFAGNCKRGASHKYH